MTSDLRQYIAEYTVAIFWRYPIRRRVKYATALEFRFNQGSGNFEIWIGPADDDDVINETISTKKNMYISPVTKTNDNWQSYNSF